MSIVDEHGRLRVCGASLVGEHGRPVMLRGMSLFWSQWAGSFYTDAWIERLIADWRIDIVRAALGLEPDGYVAHPRRELDKLDVVVRSGLSRGIYVIVDWHGHNPHTGAAMEFFGEMAKKYAGFPNLIWEPWNEPREETWTSRIKPHHRAVLDVIRGAGNSNLVVCGTGSHCRSVDIAAADPLDDPNVAYGLHFYAGSHGQGLRDRVRNALDRGICVFASEYGLGEDDGDGMVDTTEIRRWWEFLEEHRISNLNWSYFDKDEACAALRPRGRLLRPVSSHKLSRSGRLVRAYLRSAAKDRPSGTPC
jgi:endoglucanase